MINKALQEKLNMYEQVYYSLDEPVPFKEGKLPVYPVLVKDYYKFYSYLPCLTIDKNVKEVMNEDGIIEKVSNKEGMKKSYMRYIIDIMESPDGGVLINQLMGLFELIFHIPRSIYCPHCGAIKTYEDGLKGIDEYCNNFVEEVIQNYKKSVSNQDDMDIQENFQLPDTLKQKLINTAKNDFLQKYTYKCTECNESMRDIFAIKTNGNKKCLVIKDIELTAKDIDELKALVPRQNILDYDGDKYIDQDLKEELEIKAKLKNKDYTSPTLEKQIICVAISTGYELGYIKNEMTMRKLSYFLRMADVKPTYFAQLQAGLSGMVKFKQDPPHWIFSESKKNIAQELTEYKSFEDKFKHVV